jgi:hypothetical protein
MGMSEVPKYKVTLDAEAAAKRERYMDEVPTYEHMIDPDEPGLDNETRRRRKGLAAAQRFTRRQLFELAVRAGIYNSDGTLTPPYATEEGSIHRWDGVFAPGGPQGPPIK